MRSFRSSRVLIGPSLARRQMALVTSWCPPGGVNGRRGRVRGRPSDAPSPPLRAAGAPIPPLWAIVLPLPRTRGAAASARARPQQFTEQNANAVRARLHVDTLQTQYAVRKGISFLQVLQRFQKADSIVLLPGPRREGQRLAAGGTLTSWVRNGVVTVLAPNESQVVSAGSGPGPLAAPQKFPAASRPSRSQAASASGMASNAAASAASATISTGNQSRTARTASVGRRQGRHGGCLARSGCPAARGWQRNVGRRAA